jgi:hypothetical protein
MAVRQFFSKIADLRLQGKRMEMQGAKNLGVVKSLAIGAGTLAAGAGVARYGAPALRLLFRGTTRAPIVSGAGSVAAKKNFGNALKGAYERALGNPFGGGVKSFFGRIAGRAVGAPLFATGAAFAKSSVTGEPINLSKDALIKGSVGFALGGPVGYLVGTGLGIGEVGVKKGIDLVQNIPRPNFPSAGEFGEDLGELFRETGAGVAEFSQGFGSGVMSPMSATYGISGPSLSVDSGRGGIPPELLAILVAILGVAGARAYLKRRKKKKSKKRKK